jgi:hypothetical protein
MRNPSSIRAEEHWEVWNAFKLGCPLRLVTVLRVVLFSGLSAMETGARHVCCTRMRPLGRTRTPRLSAEQHPERVCTSYLDISATVIWIEA